MSRFGLACPSLGTVRGALALITLVSACGDEAAPGTTVDAGTGTGLDASSVVLPEPFLDAAIAPDAMTQVDPNAPTWHQDIAPLVTTKCTSCHLEGGIAPFALTDYASAKSMAGAMAIAVESGSMPPFLAQETDECQPKLPWKNDIRLSDAEKKLLRSWADAGAPEGDPSAAVELTPPAAQTLEREDVVMTLPFEVEVSGTKDLHKCVIVDPKLAEDGYVIGRLITSGNASVLHHVVSYLLKPKQVPDLMTLGLFTRAQTREELLADVKSDTGVGPGEAYDCFGGPSLELVEFEMLDAWAPGGMPNMAPAESGQPISKDALVLLDMHYHPTGSAQTDSATKLSLMLSKEKPKYVSRTVLIGNFEQEDVYDVGVGNLVKQADEEKAEFLIPAGAKDHVEEMTWTWTLPQIPGATDPTTIRVFGMGTHMHYVGRDMRITLEHKTPLENEDAQECLIETPAWDFNWQRGYSYDAGFDSYPQMRDGDVLNFRCVFDNTLDNRFVVQALDDQNLTEPQEVLLGEDTLDEMCLGALGIIYPNTN